MPKNQEYVKMLAAADRHKERGYELISEYMIAIDGNQSFTPEMLAVINTARRLQTSDDDVESTVGNLAFVALVGYMERYENERDGKDEPK